MIIPTKTRRPRSRNHPVQGFFIHSGSKVMSLGRKRCTLCLARSKPLPSSHCTQDKPCGLNSPLDHVNNLESSRLASRFLFK